MKREANRIISLQQSKIDQLSTQIKDAIQKLKPEIIFKFPKYRNSKEYSIIRNEILKITRTDISNSTLCNLIQKEHNGKMSMTIFNSISKFIEYVINYSETPVQQFVLWGPDYSKPPGIFINSIEGQYISWDNLKNEIEKQVIQGCPRLIPIDSKIQVLSFYKKVNHIVRVFNNSADIVGDIWLGRDPENDFVHDGLIRIGKTLSDTEWIVYQIYQRYSDGTYRLVKTYV